MVRPRRERPGGETGAPRQRGDGPSATNSTSPAPRCSPPARGWSGPTTRSGVGRRVLPASAGMVRRVPRSTATCVRAPRQRGDGPEAVGFVQRCAECSPPARGWSLGIVYALIRSAVLPASAGMVPSGTNRKPRLSRAPRQRGDGPRPGRRCLGHDDVLPASAGMVPRHCVCAYPFCRAPRQRGDGPLGNESQDKTKPCSPPARGWSPPRSSVSRE